MVPLRFANGRRAILLFEKGVTGERTVVDALQAWQQGRAHAKGRKFRPFQS